MPIINNLSGNEIEILKLADFLTGVEHDITDVYFGELQVFTVWAETEGALPLTVNANGEPLTDYKIYGSTVQDGTPTPENPVMPSGCGKLETTGAHAGQYKLPLTANGVEYPIYLGEVETTRKIAKYECTGEENWQLYSDSVGVYGAWQFYANDLVNGAARTSACSNIAGYGVTTETRNRYPYGAYLVTSGTGIGFQMAGAKDVYTGVTAWKSFLAAQYANGTPVTIWYVLTEPETGIVNEPLMKIGDYADEISGTGLPTLNSVTVYDCDLAVKPSKMYVKYRKHGT